MERFYLFLNRHQLKPAIFAILLSLAMMMIAGWLSNDQIYLKGYFFSIYVASWFFLTSNILILFQNKWLWFCIVLGLWIMVIHSIFYGMYVWGGFLAILMLECSRNFLSWNKNITPSWDKGRWIFSYALSSFVFAFSWMLLASMFNEPVSIHDFMILWWGSLAIVLFGNAKIEGWIASILLYVTMVHYYYEIDVPIISAIFVFIIILNMISFYIWLQKWKRIKAIKDAC